MSGPRVEAVRAVLPVALGDFQRPTPVELRLEVDARDDDELVWVHGDDGGSGFRVEESSSEAEVLVLVADFLQDQVFDQLGETWGEARPPCPGHQHAADPVVLDDEAWWRCPRTHDRVGRIGTLGQAAG